MPCPSCDREVEPGAWICPFCDFILDPSVLGGGRDRETSARPVWSEQSTDAPDAMILGDVNIDPDDFQVLPGAGASGDGRTSTFLFYTSGATSRVLRPDVIPVREPSVAERAMPTTPYEDFILAAIDGKKSVRDIQRSSGLAPQEVTITLLTLIDKRVVRIEPPPDEAPSPRAPEEIPVARPRGKSRTTKRRKSDAPSRGGSSPAERAGGDRTPRGAGSDRAAQEPDRAGQSRRTRELEVKVSARSGSDGLSPVRPTALAADDVEEVTEWSAMPAPVPVPPGATTARNDALPREAPGSEAPARALLARDEERGEARRGEPPARAEAPPRPDPPRGEAIAIPKLSSAIFASAAATEQPRPRPAMDSEATHDAHSAPARNPARANPRASDVQTPATGREPMLLPPLGRAPSWGAATDEASPPDASAAGRGGPKVAEAAAAQRLEADAASGDGRRGPPANMTSGAGPSGPAATVGEASQRRRESAPPSSTARGDLAVPRASDVSAPRMSDVFAPRMSDVSAPRMSDVFAPRAGDVSAPRAGDVSAPRASDIPAPRVVEPVEAPSSRSFSPGAAAEPQAPPPLPRRSDPAELRGPPPRAPEPRFGPPDPLDGPALADPSEDSEPESEESSGPRPAPRLAPRAAPSPPPRAPSPPQDDPPDDPTPPPRSVPSTLPRLDPSFLVESATPAPRGTPMERPMEANAPLPPRVGEEPVDSSLGEPPPRRGAVPPPRRSEAKAEPPRPEPVAKVEPARPTREPAKSAPASGPPAAAPSRPAPRAPVRSGPPPDGAQMAKAAKLFEEATKEKAAGNLVSARMNMKLAITFDPTNVLYQQAYEDLAKAAPPGTPSSSSKARDLYDKASAAERMSRFDEAIELLESALVEHKDPQVYNRLGVLLAMKKNEFARAQELIETALVMSPGNPTYQHNLSKVLQRAAAHDVKAREGANPGRKKDGLLGSLLGRRK